MVTNQLFYRDKPLIWPLPNQCRWKDGQIGLGAEVSLSFAECFEQEAELMISMLASEGLEVFMLRSGGAIQLLQTDDPRVHEEGYVLEVAEDGIVLQAQTGKGMFYGLQSLMQLISNAGGRNVPFVSILDAPFKSVRGVHIYVPPRHQLGWFKRYVDFLAKYKFNTIIMEVSATMKYDSHPEINEAWVKFCTGARAFPGGADDGLMPRIGHFKNSVHIENAGGGYLDKEEMSELLAYIKQRHIEVIPEMQSLSHSYWLLLAHPECAERNDDPYPDTYCPSNPRAYEIYFDCLQEVLDVFKPKTVHIGHDELYTIGMCEQCNHKTGHDLLAEDVTQIHDWLAERGVKTAMWGDKLFEYVLTGIGELAGLERLNFNRRTRKNELMRATHRAVDRIPSDILILDWYHSLNGDDTASQDYFSQRGFNEIFGNFDDIRWLKDGFPNLEERLRRPNVLGAEFSLWHEVSDLGMALKDSPVCLLDGANILWNKGYRTKMRHELNQVIAQIYPLERDRLNESVSLALHNDNFESIDIYNSYNVPLTKVGDYDFMMSTKELPNTVPFEIGKGVKDFATEASCILAGHGMPETLTDIPVGGHFRAIAFLHSYTEDLGRVPLRSCSYIDLDKDVVGQYAIEYEDGMVEYVPVIYSRTITSLDNEFNAYWSNPVYQTAIVEETIVHGIVSKTVVRKARPYVVFSYEWKNPYPDKKIRSISIEHDAAKRGGIVVFGMTGIK